MDTIGTSFMDFNMSWIDNDAPNNQPITSSGSGVSVPVSSSLPPGSKRSLSSLDQGSVTESTRDTLSPPVGPDLHSPPQTQDSKRPCQDSQHEIQVFKRTRKE